MNLRDNLKFLMDQGGYNPHSLAASTGVKQPTIFRILEGESKTPRDSTVKPLADFFGVTIEQLRYGDCSNTPKPNQNVEFPPEAGRPSPSRRMAPIISWVQAGDWNEAVDAYARGYGEGYEPIDATDGPHVFWLRVKGDSMTSPTGVSIPEGYLIKVDPDARAESGSLVVAKLEDTQEVTFKKLVIDAGQKYLKPLNPAYRTIPINGNCRIVGVVKEVRLKL